MPILQRIPRPQHGWQCGWCTSWQRTDRSFRPNWLPGRMEHRSSSNRWTTKGSYWSEALEGGRILGLQSGAPAPRRAYAALHFRSVNRKDSAGYDPALQRHHLLPRQLLNLDAFAPMIDELGRQRIGFEDFRRNGLLLPAREAAVVRLGLPLHRGPHRHYNTMVVDRVGQIEHGWQAQRRDCPDRAGAEALFRLALLQQALRRRLLRPEGRGLMLNSNDPLGFGYDYSELDAMAERLWAGTQAVAAASASFAP